VHLADFPVADKSQIDKTLAADTQLAMKISSLGRAARSQAGIKVRQPIAEVVVWIPGSRQEESLERFKFQILEELNAKDLKFGYDYRFEQVAELDGHGYAVAGVEGEIDPQKGVWLRTGPLVAVSTEIPPELLAEGVAREIVRRLQTMRRSAGFDISDHITTYYQGDDYIRQVLTDFADYIKQETLSQQLVEGVPEADAFTESHKLSGHEITLGVKRLGV
jgi:isoleucyl-tRNA synthetase